MEVPGGKQRQRVNNIPFGSIGFREGKSATPFAR
jgi:hypothetical protein